MIFQRDILGNIHIAEQGCVYLCLLYSAGKITGYGNSIQDILTLYKDFVKRGWMEKDCTVIQDILILDDLGVKAVAFNTTDKNYDLRDDQFALVQWVYKPLDYVHTVCAREKAITTYDPWGISITERIGTFDRATIYTVQY